LSDSDSKFVAGDYSYASRSQKMWSGSDNTFGIPGDIYLCVWYIKEALHVIKNSPPFPWQWPPLHWCDPTVDGRDQ